MAKKEPDLPPDDAGRVASVTEFTRRVKELLEGGLPPCWVQGEVSNLRAQASGHVYFSLKDAGAQLSCVLFRGDAGAQSLVLRDGLAVLAYGEVSVYEARGQYQLVVRALVDHGAGRLQQELEKLKQRLAAEGLFAAERKQPIPLVPRTVGSSLRRPAPPCRTSSASSRGAAGRAGSSCCRPRCRARAPPPSWPRCSARPRPSGFSISSSSPRGRQHRGPVGLQRGTARARRGGLRRAGHLRGRPRDRHDAVRLRRRRARRDAQRCGRAHLQPLRRRHWRLQQAAGSLVDSLETAVAGAAEKLDHARSGCGCWRPPPSSSTITSGSMTWATGSVRAAGRRAAPARVARHRRARFATVSPEKRVQLESHRLLGLWKRLESASPASVLKRGYAIVRTSRANRFRGEGRQPGQALRERVPRRQVARAGGIKGWAGSHSRHPRRLPKRNFPVSLLP